MTPPRPVHQSATRVLSAIMVAIGAALIVQALAGAAGATAIRVVLGALFMAAGAGRLWALGRGGGRRGR